jgi:NADPH-dependent glutamate synthase beta subunit-like oxidoreductase/NAD-dependent dihydropyrimidine dehydrogenase PreA subunit
MKQRKDRLHRVLIIGATPSGIAAANKLGELGIPVTLVDPDPDLDSKLSGDEWRLPSGAPFNYAHRPGLLRILGNPSIRCLFPSDILSLRHTPQGFRAKIRKRPTFINPDQCILCGRCSEICPVVTPDGLKPIQFGNRTSLPGRPVIDKRREPLCQTACPLGVNAQGYIALTRAGRYQEALELVRRDNVLPGICGRICTHPCEEACRRSELDDPLSIRDIKRFIADYERSRTLANPILEAEPRNEKIAIIGSGPAGLAAGADLARLGYPVTIFEKEAEPGGLLRYGIGEHRLPRDIIDYEIDYIRRLGVEILTRHPVEGTQALSHLQKEYDAVITTVGAWHDRRLGVPGEDLDGVEGCLSFLNRFHRGEKIEVGEQVAVIGDGNAAFDLARTLRRLGAKVKILSWFPLELIPADQEEIKGALEEEITIIDRVQTVAFQGQKGRLEKIQGRPTEPGQPDENGVPWPVIIPASETIEFPFDQAFIAIGQRGAPGEKDESGQTRMKTLGLRLNEKGYIQAEKTHVAGNSRLYAAGDAVNGPSSVVEAMASGRAVAETVNRELSHGSIIDQPLTRPLDRDFQEIPPELPSLARPQKPERQPAARENNFNEVSLGLNESQIISETQRCLQCGICSECLQCVEVCRPVGAIDHLSRTEDILEQAGVVIIADPEVASPIKGEDVIRAYGPKAAKSDVYDMITRGYAAAADAMILFGASSNHPKGHGLTMSPPDPELSPEIRVGVFVCRCNDAFGWHEDMEGYIRQLPGKKGVAHAEVLVSACVPEGSAHILRAIRDQGITRVVLASCVCCPLDFICSACTDQRNRLKNALFRGTGVSRSMVETCNLRGEALRHLHHDPFLAFERFQGLIDRSIHRARMLRPLPALARNYNFTTAVIGQSEAALNSARTLAETGFEVFLFGTPDRPLRVQLDHPNIHCFNQSVLKGISGTLGNFQVFVESTDLAQTLQVGVVILGERSRKLIPYMYRESPVNSIAIHADQQRGLPGTPFLYPGVTSIAGLLLADPPGVHVSARKKGAAAAALAASIMPRGPRQSKGYTVVIDELDCRGCGRCIEVCPYQAIRMRLNSYENWYAEVDEALCKGCGNCISVCPTNAADSPYRDQAYLEQIIEEVLV